MTISPRWWRTLLQSKPIEGLSKGFDTKDLQEAQALLDELER